MWWILISLCACVTATELSCNGLPECDDSIVSYTPGEREFLVQGHKIEYHFYDRRNDRGFRGFSIDCGGWEALDSPALPRFAEEFRMPTIDFSDCPLPRNDSLVSVLARLNVVPQPIGDRFDLELSGLPENSLLTSKLFVGFEQLTHVNIASKYGVDPLQRPVPEPGFLAGFQKLRTLHLRDVRLPAGEIDHLPHSITRLWLNGYSLNFLPATLPEIIGETLRALPGLQHLMLDSSKFTATSSSATNIAKQLTTPSLLESIYLSYWNEKRLAPLEHCDGLKSFEIHNAKVEELPDRWVAACPSLEEITVFVAEQLTSLPAKLLDGATGLKRLRIRLTKINSLPDGFLEGASNLIKLDLSDNRLRTFSSAAFLGPALKSLSLQSNKLASSSLKALAPLTTLEHLDISDHEYMYDVCEPNGYSPLQNLTQLKSLSLKQTSITRVCRDWRENLTFLEKLDLTVTNILELHFTDLLYTRDASVRHATVKFSNTVTSIELTKEDYEAALTVSGPAVTLSFKSDNRVNKIRNVACNCRTYWLRRVVDASRDIRINGLYCSDQRKFKSVSANEMCPELAGSS